MQPRAFRRNRWERVATPDVVEELAAEHDGLDEAAQIEASQHVDEVSDEDLARELADRGGSDGETGDEPPARRSRRAAE